MIVDEIASARVGAIVLAAGRSTRMRDANKLLADFGGQPVIVRTIDALAAAGLPPPVIVLGHMADDIRAVLCKRRAIFVVAADLAAGMGRSIAAGITTAPASWRAALIVLGDMPAVAPDTLANIAAAAEANVVVVPVNGGRRGNPVAWGRDHWPSLALLGGDRGARDLLVSVEVIELATNDDGIFADVDTPEALAALRQSHGSSSN